MGFSDLVSFLTVLPAGGRSVRGAASAVHYAPAVGFMVGVPAGLLGWLVSMYAGPLAGAVAALAAACIMAGFHHVDGLADFADGVMAHGSRERRLAAMRDTATGAGGITAVVLCLMMTAAAASQVAGMDLLALVVFAEVAAKYSLVVAAAAGRAASEGSGSLFCNAAGPRRLAASTCMWLMPGVMLMWLIPDHDLGLLMMLAGAAAGVAAVVMTVISHRAFGVVTGDVMGATHEVGRAAAVICMVSWWAA